MKNKHEVKLNGVSYNVMVDYSVINDDAYGADADGNRGVPVTFIEYDLFDAVASQGGAVTDKATLEKLEAKIDEYILNNHNE